ncbi:hypothetical protein MVEG_03065 [Podila verticillata NRRL 6337]|nr:hypothetical protein MVEG_03065 [Podila verticillata NRRL 6337]
MTMPCAGVSWYFLKQCVNVRVVTLNVDFPSEQFYRVCKTIANSLASNLKELSLQGPRNDSCFGMSSKWYLYIIPRCLSKLEKLTIYNDPLPGDNGDFVSEKPPIAEVKFLGLKELVLDHCWSKDELSMWDWLWRGCCNVERLELRTWSADLTYDLAARIRLYLPKFNSIVVKHMILWKAIAPLLSACAGGWKNIQLDATLDQMTCDALAKQCATLKVLEVMNILTASSKTLRCVLSSGPRLKALITIDEKWHHRNRIPYLYVNEFIDLDSLSNTLNPWASEMSLKMLKAKIKCIQGRMSSAFWLEDYQYDCLEMTLESGLDQLKDLKNL